MDCLKHRDVERFGATVFRRVGTQITSEGGLWDSSKELYPFVGGRGLPGKLEWRFTNGFKVRFRHLEDDKAIKAQQGSQIPYIGFDELTHFTRYQFFYMLSRNRSMTGIPARLRATCNADSTSWVAEFIAWWIGDDGYPLYERSGLLRFMVREKDEIIWFNSREDAEAQFGKDRALSVTFIPAKITDNLLLLAKDPGYRAKLASLGHVEREQLELGNWKIRAAAGLIFRREWFRMVRAAPVEGTTVRYWDRAATPAAADDALTTGPDWTVGVRMTRLADGRFVISDVRRLRGTPSEVEEAIKNTAAQDGQGTIIGIEQDPGSAGKAEAGYHVRNLAGYDVRVFPVTKAKLIRATPFSAQCEAGNVACVVAPWNDPFFGVLEAFPDGPKDDDVDAASGAFNALAGGLGHFVMA